MILASDFGVSPGNPDNSSALQAAINDAVASYGGGSIDLGPGKLKMTSVVLADNITLVGRGRRVTTLVALDTTKDGLLFSNDTADHGNFVLRDFGMNYFANCISVSDTGGDISCVEMRNLDLCPTIAGIKTSHGCSKWYLDNIVIEGGQYGFRSMNIGPAPLLDTCTFKDVVTTGQTINGWLLDGSASHTCLTWINPVFQHSAQHSFLANCPGRSWQFINPSTEGIGYGSTTPLWDEFIFSGSVYYINMVGGVIGQSSAGLRYCINLGSGGGNLIAMNTQFGGSSVNNDPGNQIKYIGGNRGV